MIDKKQCPAHTRAPWGNNPHRYSQRLRYFLMALLTFLFFSIILVLIVNLALHFTLGSFSNDDVLPGVDNLKQSASTLKDHSLLRTCNGQFNSCGDLDKPYFCCPSETNCRYNPFSPSGIHCCGSVDGCITSPEHPPRCIAGAIQCSAKEGGGCCPKDLECSLGGCIQESISKIASTSSKKARATSITAAKSSEYCNSSSSVAPKVAGASILNSSATQVNMSIFTGVKFGEIAEPIIWEALRETQESKGCLIEVRLGLSFGISLAVVLMAAAAAL